MLLVGEDVEPEAGGRDAAACADALDQFLDLRDFEFDDLVGVDADEDVTRARLAVDDLVVRLFAVDEDALDDAGLGEELERAVDGCFADAEAVGFEACDDLFGLEEPIETEDDVEDVGAFGGVFEAFGAEGASEDGADGLDDGECGCGGGLGGRGGAARRLGDLA